MQLIVISNPEAIANEAGIINRLFEAGLTRLHLRKPGYSEQKMAALLKQIDEQFYHHIALHQYHETAQDFGIERLHYTEQQRMNISAGKLAAQNKQGYILSTSIHNVAVLPSLKWFDYAFLSPVFNSISKPGYMTNFAESLYLNKQCNYLNIIALGGINMSNINKIKAMNFDGAAVLGTIWNEPEIAVSNFKNLKQELQVLTENHDNR